MIDFSYLSTEAKQIHDFFGAIFWLLVPTLLCLGVMLNYFKASMGGGAPPEMLITRSIIAIIMFLSFREITASLSLVTEGIAQKVGDFSTIERTLGRVGELLDQLTLSWTSLKTYITYIISYSSFLLLYISVYLLNAGFVFVWTLLYVFSPILIAFFVLPETAGVTKSLFRSLIEVSLWKIVWGVLAALLWSMALSKINSQPNINFLTVIALNLILAISMVLTPLFVNAFVGKGLGGGAFNMLGLSALTVGLSPGVLAKVGATKAATLLAGGGHAAKHIKKGALSAAPMGAAALKASNESKPSVGHAPVRIPRPPRWHSQVPLQRKPPPELWQKLQAEKESKK